MKKYVLVIVNGANHTIGRNRYTKDEAVKKQSELAKFNLKMKVMHESEAFGL